MTTFDKREEGFDKQFALEEELRFKALDPGQVAAVIAYLKVVGALSSLPAHPLYE
jgi:hypothetical protein